MSKVRQHLKGTLALFAAGVISIVCVVSPVGTTSARPQRITNTVAVFSALDKVTARIKKLEIPINETVRFGSLKVTPRACYSRPPEVLPKTSTFVQVDEVLLNGSEKRIFSGWMFAENPAIHAVEHPVYDVWLTRCDKPGRQSVEAAAANEAPGGKSVTTDVPQPLTRRRIRR